MSTLAAVGIGVGSDAYLAAANACNEALETLKKTPHLYIVYASVAYDQTKMLAGIRSVSGDALVVGCSTAGEIATSGPIKDHSIVVMAIYSETIKFCAAVGENIKDGAEQAGENVANAVKACAREELKSFVMFPDVLAGNGADIVRGILKSLGEYFPVVGGAAGDDFAFKTTYQYLNDKVYTGSVVGLGLSGDFKIGIGVKHGWMPIGKPHIATKSAGSVLHELDNKPAITIYDEYFGDAARELRDQTLAKLAVTYPLGISNSHGDEMLIRDPLTVDASGSITCAAEIPEGSEVYLMVGSREEAVKVAKEAAALAVEQLQGAEPKFVLVFNCIARNKLFGDRGGDEINAIQESIGKQVPLIGFYTYGEQAPLYGEVKNLEKCSPGFHNETVVIAVIA